MSISNPETYPHQSIQANSSEGSMLKSFQEILVNHQNNEQVKDDLSNLIQPISIKLNNLHTDLDNINTRETFGLNNLIFDVLDSLESISDYIKEGKAGMIGMQVRSLSDTIYELNDYFMNIVESNLEDEHIEFEYYVNSLELTSGRNTTEKKIFEFFKHNFKLTLGCVDCIEQSGNKLVNMQKLVESIKF